MRLTKLELNGFKSFAHRTELVFTNGVTAIIGPNGSGKSNIADAVRWVLGEQSARALRGTKMEDVIFSGTQQKKAQAYCEVTLTFDNADGSLPLDFAEVALTRRVYRSGESEYCINKNPCRLRDIVELFRDTGVGRDGYSIIGQGKVDEILSNKSGDRRAALEEAAGVMRFRVRKEEAVRKLDNTQKNIERIEDILQELSGRLGPLEEQSRSAREFLRLRDELKDLEINIYLYQFDRYRERIEAASAAILQMQTEAGTTEETQKTLLGECAALETQIRLMDQTLADQQNKLLVALSGVEMHVGESNVLVERRDHALSEQTRLLDELEQLNTRKAALSRTLGGMTQDDAALEAIRLLDLDVEAAEESLSCFDGEIMEAEAQVDRLKNSIIEAMNRLSDARSRLSHFDTMKGAFASRISEVEVLIQKQQATQEALKSEYEAAQDELTRAEAFAGKQKESLTVSLQNAESLRAKLSQTVRAQQAFEQRMSASEQRLRVLREMARSREGYYQSVKNVMRDAEREPKLRSSIIGVFAELISVPREYEQAISMALGSAMQNIITNTAEDAQYVIEYLRKSDYGRATLLPLALLRTNTVRDAERALLKQDGCIGMANELITYDHSIRGAVDYLLGRTAIVRDLESGIRLKKKADGAFHIATLDGDIIATGGAMSGGSNKKRELSLLGREREMEELDALLKNSAAKRRQTEQEVEALQREILLAETQTDAFRASLREAELDATRKQEKTDIIRRDIDRAGEAVSAFLEEKQKLFDNIDDLEQERRQADAVTTDIESGNATTREDVIMAQRALAEQRAKRETISAQLTEKKVRRMALSKEQDAVLGERRRLQAEAASVEASITQSETALDRSRALAQQVMEAFTALQGNIVREQTDANAQKDAQHALEEERSALADRLTELRERRESLLSSSRDLQERLHRQELNKSRLEMEFTGMQAHIWEEYELTYENAFTFRHEITIGATNARIAEIKTGIRELGDVNVSSIEDYKAVFERHSQLSTQCEDLQKAQRDLETLIAELTKTMEAQFAKQFAIIQQNFTKVFSELFGGGHAELRLSDHSDVLGCEIDIIAQPPGKKLQLLTLLSGGERALTAIALLFAMLKLKPPAFCILDEIESSLDDVNVTRFANYLRDYTDDTQFILITHRKGSMEVCDSLYGVSMEERGISRIVSAKFGEVS